jgi:hypothetical protein
VFLPSTSLNRSDRIAFGATEPCAFRSPGMALATLADGMFTLEPDTSALQALRNFHFVPFDSY